MDFRGRVKSIEYGPGRGLVTAPWMIDVACVHAEDCHDFAAVVLEEHEHGRDMRESWVSLMEPRFTVGVETEQRDGWLAWIIHYLAPHLGRDQELRASIEFDLSP